MKGTICIGKGAVLFQDVAFALELLSIPYETLDENKVKGGLEGFGFLIVPGGYTGKYMPALKDVGREAIHNFIEELAIYKNGELAVVASQFGEVKVVIFSLYPEGSISQGIEPAPETLTLLYNSVEFCLYRI